MWVKRVVTTCLLVFIGITVVVMATNGFRASTPANEAASLPEGAAESTPDMIDGVIVYYFHSDTRCPTCRTIEAFAQEAMNSRFSNEMAEGDVRWRVLNYEDPGNRQQVERYEILAPIVVVSRIESGKETTWSRLDKVWQLTDDKEAFAEYISDEIHKLVPFAVHEFRATQHRPLPPRAAGTKDWGARLAS